MKTLLAKKPKVSIHDESLEGLVQTAMNKVSVETENELCHYIPYSDARIHHFTYKNLKKNEPEQVKSLIKKHILEKEPTVISPKPRAKKAKNIPQPSKSTEKNPPQPATPTSQITRLEKMLEKFIHALDSRPLVDNHEPTQSISSNDRHLRTVQNQLIKAIRHKRVDHELWDAYVELVETL